MKNYHFAAACMVFALSSCFPKGPEKGLYTHSGTWNIESGKYAYAGTDTQYTLEQPNAGFIMFLENYGAIPVTDPEGNFLDTYEGLLYAKIGTGNQGISVSTPIEYCIYSESLNVFGSQTGIFGGAYNTTQTGNTLTLIKYGSNYTLTLYLKRLPFNGPMPDYL